MIAYFILFHKDFAQFQCLFESIYDSDNFYLIHLDAKADSKIAEELRRYVASYPNVLLMKQRKLAWAGFTSISIVLDALRILTKHSKQWKFFVNLSGTDMPLANQKTIAERLHGHEAHNFFEMQNPREYWWNPDYRIKFFHIELRWPQNKVFRIPRIRRPFPKDMAWWGGSQWFILSRPFCEYLSDKKNTKFYERFFRWTLLSDEMFFQTVIMNSSFASSVVPDNQRYIVFNDNTAHPKILTLSDFDNLKQSGKLFARKFSVKNEPEIIARIQRDLLSERRADLVQSSHD